MGKPCLLVGSLRPTVPFKLRLSFDDAVDVRDTSDRGLKALCRMVIGSSAQLIVSSSSGIGLR